MTVIINNMCNGSLSVLANVGGSIMPTKFGITYEVVDVDNQAHLLLKQMVQIQLLTAVMTDGTQTITLNFNNTTSGDPDTVFNTETSVFQYFEDDYLENNPGTINNVIISYVGDYWSDTVEGQHTLFGDEE